MATIKKRTFSVTITFKEGAGDAVTLTGEQAQNFWNMFNTYANGTSLMNGFHIVDVEKGTDCIILFENIAQACRSAITESDLEIEGCTDLNLCVESTSSSDDSSSDNENVGG